MDEFLSLTICSRDGESEADFKARLSRFWTHMLRQFKDDFEKVYAEASAFDHAGGCRTRQYLIEEEVVSLLERELRGAELDFQPIDRDDTYSRYEAIPPDWMQIEH
jgi:hypothetical protein